MRLELVSMTPAMAHQLLVDSSQQTQRPLGVDRVHALAEQIKGGEWRTTHQAIAIDPSGILIDGQHRLAAIDQAGIPVEILVAYDADPDTFGVIDSGRARSAADALHIAGYTRPRDLSSSARTLLLYEDIANTRAPRFRKDARALVSTAQLLEVMESERGAILMARIPDAERIARQLGRTGIRSWLTAAMALIDESGADAGLRLTFQEKLEKGMRLNSGDPILAYRNWLTKGTGYELATGSNRAALGIATAIKAWNAWMSGRELRIFTWKPGIEMNPLPMGTAAPIPESPSARWPATD